ncbi:MAG TPA: hypothetical protein VGG03_03330 [Thermoanaerobaculia bacterium]|jgi:hypothetical protein
MGPVAAGTIAAKSYLSLARVLADSFLERHPNVPFFVLLADEVDGCFEPAAERFRLLRLTDLGVPRLERFRFQHPQQPLSYAATPYLLSHLLDRGFTRAVFFKQESLVLGDQAPVFALLDRYSIVLTPHLLAPLAGGERVTRELNILQSGVFNVGFLGVSNTATARRFLAWWQDRVYGHCRHAVAEGLHYEQRWIDLVPAFFEDVHVLRDPGFNVGHWNLPERHVEIRDGAVLVDGQPCRLFRFSGFDPEEPQAATKHSRRLTMANLGPAAAVFARYLSLLAAAGYHETRSWPYAYGCFDNGVAVPDVARQIYRELGEAVEAFGDPFRAAGSHSYFHWLNQPVDDPPDPSRTVSRLWQAVYRQRPDVERAFPDLLGADRDGFLAWTASSGAREHGIPEPFWVHRAP